MTVSHLRFGRMLWAEGTSGLNFLNPQREEKEIALDEIFVFCGGKTLNFSKP